MCEGQDDEDPQLMEAGHLDLTMAQTSRRQTLEGFSLVVTVALVRRITPDVVNDLLQEAIQ